MSSPRECTPSVNSNIPTRAAGLHVKHNHLALITAGKYKSTQQVPQSNGVSVLKRQNQMNIPYVPSISKIPKLSNPPNPKYNLMTINDASMHKTTSVSGMACLLKSQGLATPNKHVNDIPNLPQTGSQFIPAGDKPKVNISWLPKHMFQNGHSSVNQTFQHSSSTMSVSTLDKNSSVQWRHYGIGQSAQSHGVYQYRPTFSYSAEGNAPSNTSDIPFHRQNLVTSTPKAPPQYKLMPRKPVTPVHLVRNKHVPVPNNCAANLSPVPAIPLGSEVIENGERNQKERNSHSVNVYKSPEELSNQKPTCAVRRISFSPEKNMERVPLDNINLNAYSESQTALEQVVNMDDALLQEVDRYIEHMMVKKNENVFDICDQLKYIKPYVISGWISSTYLLALMQKSNLVNEMFDNALDNVGDIRAEVVKNCRKTTPSILARDLVFRLFTLDQLNGLNLQKLSKNKMSAIRRCIKKHFPDFNMKCWKKKCIPQIKASLLTLFRHRVKHVQEFWMSHSTSQPLDLTKVV
jgi:hypothetical protein